MDKLFLGISWRGNPTLGVTLCYQGNSMVELRVVFFGLDLFGLQFKRTREV